MTSRLGADCQQVSRVIGNDLNLILRNFLQVHLFNANKYHPQMMEALIGLFFHLVGWRFINLLVDFVLATWFMYIVDMLCISSDYVTLWKVILWFIFFEFVAYG